MSLLSAIVRTSYKTRTPRATPDASSTGERIRARGPGGRGPTPLGATLVAGERRASALGRPSPRAESSSRGAPHGQLQRRRRSDERSSTAERRRFTRGRAAAAAASMARKARMAWFRSTEAKRAPSRVATTIRITPSVRPVTGASAAQSPTKKSCASGPHPGVIHWKRYNCRRISTAQGEASPRHADDACVVREL